MGVRLAWPRSSAESPEAVAARPPAPFAVEVAERQIDLGRLDVPIEIRNEAHDLLQQSTRLHNKIGMAWATETSLAAAEGELLTIVLAAMLLHKRVAAERKALQDILAAGG